MLAPLALLAVTSSVWIYTGPRPEQAIAFRDWVTGCDNQRNCSAIALAPVAVDVDGPAEHLEIHIEQASAAHLDPVVRIKPTFSEKDDATLALSVDDTAIALPVMANGRFVFTAATARGLVRKMRAGKHVILRNQARGVVASASLAGLTAALLRIDEQQGKVDTPRAFVRIGKRVPYDDLPGYGVSISRPARSNRPPAAPDAKAIAEFYANDQCEGEPAPSPAPVIRLDDENTMMIAPWRCGSGAYNLYSNILIVNNSSQIQLALFDYDNGVTGEGPSNVVVNVAWDDDKRVLESFIKHRGIGDCGRVDRYIWGGEKFMLSEQLLMPECRMAFDKIRTWRVDVVDR